MSRWLLISLLVLAQAPTAYGKEPPIREIVVIGDSLSDDGNLYMRTGGAIPPSPPYFAGRFSNGPVWVEALAESLRGEGRRPYLRNFAFAGAQTGFGFKDPPPSFGLPPGSLRIPAMGKQIANYLKNSRPDSGTLIVLFGGSNDIFFGDADNRRSVDNLERHVRQLADRGATRFLVANVPPLDMTPYGNSLDPVTRAGLGLVVADFNDQLERRLRRIERTAFVSVDLLDVDSLFRDVAADPGAYGFLDASTPAIYFAESMSPEELDLFLFWDDVHPTRTGHAVLADAAAAALGVEASSGAR